MKLSRVRIEQFKRFRQPVVIDDLAPGINLFVGPNEAGKSTIAEAIRAAFFERHRSGTVEHLRPWGDASASPAVDIDFTIGDVRALLRKRFLQRKSCELQIGGEHFEGALAEDHLADLLGFGFAGRGASSAEHHGIPGLLWISQGQAQDVDVPVRHAGAYLQRALGEALGGLASATGDTVLGEVERARNALLTAATAKPRGAYAEALEREAVLGAELAVVEAQVMAYRDKVDLLATLRREYARDADAQPWGPLRERERQAQARLDEVELLRRARAEAQQQCVQLQQRQSLLREHLEGFDAQRAQLARRNTEFDDAVLQARAADSALGTVRAAHALARGAADAARKTLALARDEETRRGLAARARELESSAARARDALDKADAEQRALIDARRDAAATELSADHLAKLREQHTRMRELQATQASGATRLRYRLEPGRALRIAGAERAGDGELLVVSATTIELPGFGSVDVTPGGADLAVAVRELETLQGEHQALLRLLGLASLDAAEARHHKHRDLLGDVRARDAALKLLTRTTVLKAATAQPPSAA